MLWDDLMEEIRNNLFWLGTADRNNNYEEARRRAKEIKQDAQQLASIARRRTLDKCRRQGHILSDSHLCDRCGRYVSPYLYVDPS